MTTSIDPLDDLLLDHIFEAWGKLAGGVANRTPTLTSRTLVERTGAKAIHLKCENFQRVGAFKFRGAYYAISKLSDEERRRGVVTYSSGNHAQAVALASRVLGAPATIVMPSTAPAPKLAATRGYGGEVVHHDLEGVGREAMAERLAAERGLTLIPPFDHPDIIAGQGTVITEMFETMIPPDVLFVPVGGGGLISGCALAATNYSTEIRVIGVEPENGDDGGRSFRSGVLERHEPGETIADGARTPSLGTITFGIIRRHVHEMTTVSDREIVRAMRFLWERMKLIVEPTGALGFAALLAGKIPVKGQRVGVVISGGNVDLAQALEWFRREDAAGD